ncbi:MAG: hypothetical protein EA398_05010 [Deltaproteobacteria bacterium]|nr:MAG: hypothetical protein EA398_05010 [Deltaproteobacteria bacterium]
MLAFMTTARCRAVPLALALAVVAVSGSAGCSGGDVDRGSTAPTDSGVRSSGNMSGGSDVAGSGESAEDATRTGPSSVDATGGEDTDADPGDTSVPDATGTEPLNACGGTQLLVHAGREASPGESCGPCEDGELVCGGPDLLECDGAGDLNTCGGCAPLDEEPGDPCGPCAAWFCDGVDEVTCEPALLGPECEDISGECEALRCASIGRRCIEEEPPLEARCGDCFPTLEESGERCLLPLRPPPDLRATEGAHADRVELTWGSVRDATGWAIYRGEERVAELEEAEPRQWADEGAPAGTFAGALGVSVEATSVLARVSLTAPETVAGAPVTYRVRALEGEREGPVSEEATGYRSAPTFARFERWSGQSWVSTGPSFTASAPAPRITLGDASASTDREDAVALTLAGAEIEDGEPAEVRVRAVARIGPDHVAPGPERTVSVRRPAGSLLLSWERSVPPDDPFLPLGLSGTAVEDTSAPADGSPRRYRACGTSPGAATACSAPVEGRRQSTDPRVALAGEPDVGVRSLTAMVELTEPGRPRAERLGLCAAVEGEDEPRCRTFPTSTDTMQIEIGIEDLPPGGLVALTPFAERSDRRFSGPTTTVRMRPDGAGLFVANATSTHVLLVWSPVAGAARYRILRDGVPVATVSAPNTSWVDSGVERGSVIPDSLELTASDDRTDGTVVVAWNLPSAQPGGLYTWRLIPLNADDVPGELTEDVTAMVEAPRVDAWQLAIDDADWLNIGARNVFRDFFPESGRIEPGELARLEPERFDAVVWSAAEAEGVPGSPRSYRLRALMNDDSTVETEPATGRAAVGPLTVAWERSTGPDLPEDDEEWVRLEDEGVVLEDTDLASDRALRWWRARVSAAGAADAFTPAVAGRPAAPPPPPVTGLVATLDTRDDGVLLDWAVQDGQARYDILREGVPIATDLTGPPFLDVDAPASPAPGAPVLSATRPGDGNALAEAVRLTWTPGEPVPGDRVDYTVIARNEDGLAAPASEPATGARGPAAITGWEVSRTDDPNDEPAFVPLAEDDVGDDGDEALTWLDTEAPRHDPEIALSAVGEPGGVRLEWAADPNTGVRVAHYRVRALTASGAGDASPSAEGGRALPDAMTVELFRTHSDGDTLLFEGTAEPLDGGYVDGLARIDGAPESYSIRVTPQEALTRDATATAARAAHDPVVLLEAALPTGDGWAIEGSITLPGTPAPARVRLCFGNNIGQSNPNSPTSACFLYDRPWQAGDGSFVLPGDPDRSSGESFGVTLRPEEGNLVYASGTFTVP